MSPMAGGVPQNYVQVEAPRGVTVVAHHRLADGVRQALASGTLYAWAAAHPERRQLQGRLPVYAAPLSAEGPRVVVRHVTHGGMLAPLLRDLFIAPTRAPLELATSLLLARAGVPTPPIAAFATYRVAPLVRRADVMSIELPGLDLGVSLQEANGEADRQRLIAPVAALLGSLTQAGAWHPDLNVKNILLVPDDAGQLHPAVIDVDRVRFVPPSDPNLREANFQRLARSVRTWRERHGAGFSDVELDAVHDRLLQDEAVEAAHRALAMEAYMP
jgi:3-deoxy-D-manno-octulosonic acid kinase